MVRVMDDLSRESYKRYQGCLYIFNTLEFVVLCLFSESVNGDIYVLH